MSDYQSPLPAGKDPELWAIAQKRASFKNHATAYVIVNLFLWGLWYFTRYNSIERGSGMFIRTGYPWPVWTTLGWGIGLAFHFAGAYVCTKVNSVEREYGKLSKTK